MLEGLLTWLLALQRLTVLLLWRFIGVPVEEDSSEEVLCWEETGRPELVGGEGWRSIGVVEESCVG